MSIEQAIADLASAIRELANSRGNFTVSATGRGVTVESTEKVSPYVATEKKPTPAKTVPVKATPKAVEPTPEPEAEDDTDVVVGFGKVTEVTTKLARAKGKPAVTTILAEFGATKIPELKESDYAEYVEMALAAIA